jgi:hypothetical protein
MAAINTQLLIALLSYSVVGSFKFWSAFDTTASQSIALETLQLVRREAYFFFRVLL